MNRVAFIVILAWIALLAAPDIGYSSSVLPCPTTTALSVPSFWIGRAAASPCPCQEWSVAYETAGGNHAASVQPTSDRGYIVALVAAVGIAAAAIVVFVRRRRRGRGPSSGKSGVP